MPDRPLTMAEELALFNEHRRVVLGNVPPDVSDDRMPLPRSGVGGDVEAEDDE